MSDDATDLVSRTRAARGYTYAAHEYLAEADPAFLADYNRLVGRALQHEGFEDPGALLTAKYRELIAIGVLCFRGAAQESIAAHMRRAQRLGATKKEILEGLQAAAAPGGGSTLMNGVRVLLDLGE